MIEPAMDTEQWAEYLDPANDWAHIMYKEYSDHSAAAVGLYDQPFGFTHEDVAFLRNQDDPNEYVQEGLHDPADRIEALLPPEGA